MLDEIALNNFSQTFKIDKFSVLREYLQIAFLNQFYKFEDAQQVYFKGGTAIRLFYHSPRFSEDLDFTTQLCQKKISLIIKKTVSNLAREFGTLRIKDIKSLTGFCKKLYLTTEIAKQPLTVRLDFSQREKIISAQLDPISTSLPISTFTLISHLSKQEILAEKIRAILTRKRGRDLFDLWFLFSQEVSIDERLINKKLAYYQKEFDYGELVKKITSWDVKSIKLDLEKFLPVDQRKIIPLLKEKTLENLIVNLEKSC